MFINKFDKFQKKLNESVVALKDRFILSGLEVDKKFVKNYIKRVEEETGNTNLSAQWSEMDVAEKIAKYIFDESLGDVESLPLNILVDTGDEEESGDFNEEVPMDEEEPAEEEIASEIEKEIEDESLPLEDEELEEKEAEEFEDESLPLDDEGEEEA